MKKAIIAIVIILVIISIYFTISRKRTQFSDEFAFHLTDTASITSIVIRDSLSEVNLSKDKDRWMVNEHLSANQSLIKQLLRLFKNIEIQIIIPESDYHIIENKTKNKGLRIQFYSDKELTGEFYIGDFNEEKNATPMLNSEGLIAYVTAPGLSKNIRKFIDTDPIFWRDKHLFNFEIDEISLIELIDYQQNKNSFLIQKQNSEFELIDFKGHPAEFDRSKLERYLSYFSNIGFESIAGFENEIQADSVLNQNPAYKIVLQNQHGKEINLKLINKLDLENQNDLNFVYGVLNNEKPVLIISYFQIDPILKRISYFR